MLPPSINGWKWSQWQKEAGCARVKAGWHQGRQKWKNSRFLDLLVQLLHLHVRIVQFPHGVTAVGLGLQEGHMNTKKNEKKQEKKKRRCKHGSLNTSSTNTPSVLLPERPKDRVTTCRSNSTGAVHGRTGSRTRAQSPSKAGDQKTWDSKTREDHTHERGPKIYGNQQKQEGQTL